MSWKRKLSRLYYELVTHLDKNVKYSQNSIEKLAVRVLSELFFEVAIEREKKITLPV